MDAKHSEVIHCDNLEVLTETIFAIVEGAYYYLGLVDDTEEYEVKVNYYKQQVNEILQFRE